MDDTRRHKWLPIFFFSLSGLIFGTALYLITAGAVAPPDPATSIAAAAAAGVPYTEAAAPRVKISLKRDARVRLDNLDITYRGLEGGKLRIEVVVLDLDPQYAYQHAIDLAQASRGFQLAGLRLKLLSARDSRAKLIWNRQG